MTTVYAEYPAKLAEDADGEVALIVANTVIDEVEKYTALSVSGSGGGGRIGGSNGYTSGYISPINISSTSNHYHRIWLSSPEGVDYTFTVDSEQTPLRSGQHVSIVYAKGEKGYVPLIFRNHATEKELMLVERSKLLKMLDTGFSPRRPLSSYLINRLLISLFIAVVSVMIVGEILSEIYYNPPATWLLGTPILVFLLSIFLQRGKQGKVVYDIDNSSSKIIKQSRELLNASFVNSIATRSPVQNKDGKAQQLTK